MAVQTIFGSATGSMWKLTKDNVKEIAIVVNALPAECGSSKYDPYLQTFVESDIRTLKKKEDSPIRLVVQCSSTDMLLGNTGKTLSRSTFAHWIIAFDIIVMVFAMIASEVVL